MSYEEALQTIIKENEKLKNQLHKQQSQITQQNSEFYTIFRKNTKHKI